MLVHELVHIKVVLEEVSNYPGIEFAYAVFKNKQLVDKKLMEVDFIKNASPQVIEYEEKRVAICEEMADKDENGNPVIKDDVYLIQDKESFRNKMDVLLEQYRPFVEERQRQIDLFNQKMNLPIDFDFIKVGIEQLPPQVQTAKDLEKLSFMIK